MSRRRKSDSHPFNFSRQDLLDMAAANDRWLDFCHPLDFISVDAIRRAQNDALRGAYAQLQWMWEQLEPADPILATCVERRLGALVRIPWDLVKKDGLNDAEDCLADAQLRTLIDFANALENLDEAIPALAQASFRHFRRIQLLETEYGNLRLNITNNWNWCRDGYQGEWMWNPAATFGVSRGEPLPVAPESIVTRLCPRPIDQPAMMLCLDRKNAKAQWLVFNGRYGTPPLFAILPDGVDEKTRADYIDFARQCVSNACGVLPNGSDVKAVSVGSTGPDTFRGMLDLSTQELVLRATGGLMTMLTAPGAGTNTDTGSAHQDAFNDLAEREAAEIAAVLDAALFAPILDQWHPGQPHLVEFVMRRPDSDNASGAVANITALAGAGYRPSAEQVSELTGLEVEDTGAPGADPSQGAGTGAAAAMLNSTRRRWLPLMKYAPARDAFERSLNSKQQRLCALNAAIAPQDPADSPLSDKELAALKNLGGVSLADFIHEDADTLSDGMLAAVAGVRSTNAEEKRHPGTGTPCHAKGKCPLEEKANTSGTQREKEEKSSESKSTDNTPDGKSEKLIQTKEERKQRHDALKAALHLRTATYKMPRPDGAPETATVSGVYIGEIVGRTKKTTDNLRGYDTGNMSRLDVHYAAAELAFEKWPTAKHVAREADRSGDPKWEYHRYETDVEIGDRPYKLSIKIKSPTPLNTCKTDKPHFYFCEVMQPGQQYTPSYGSRAQNRAKKKARKGSRRQLHERLLPTSGLTHALVPRTLI